MEVYVGHSFGDTLHSAAELALLEARFAPLCRLRRSRDTCPESWEMSVDFPGTGRSIGRAKLAEIGQIWPKSSQRWLCPGQLWSKLVNFGPNLVNAAQIRPVSV